MITVGGEADVTLVRKAQGFRAGFPLQMQKEKVGLRSQERLRKGIVEWLRRPMMWPRRTQQNNQGQTRCRMLWRTAIER
jgi:hypothetical protein